MAEQLMASAPGMESGQPIPALLKLKGEALLALNRIDEAADALQHAQRGACQRGARPLLWQIQCALGMAYQRLGRRGQARQAYAEARAVIDTLAATIDDASSRDRFLHGALARLPKAQTTAASGRNFPDLLGLTAREREVVLLIGRGRSNREIAIMLVVGERTIETHVSNILAKLGYTSRRQIADWVIARGLLEPPE
jgi:DNA-binding CsgD family transcriptional regulator